VTAVKMVDSEAGRIGGYLVVWGDETSRDLEGEYFTPQTNFALDWFPVRPVLYQHGLDGTMKGTLIGHIDTLRADEVGIWAEAQLDLRQRYVVAVRRLIDQGALSWSSGSLPHLVRKEADGRITRWPLVEGSLTPTPAEPRYTDVKTIKNAYKVLGLDVSWLVGKTTPETTGDDLMETTPNADDRRLPMGAPEATRAGLPRVSVSSPYDNLSAEDMLHGYMLLRSTKTFRGVSETYANALAHKVTKAGFMAAKSGDELSYSTQAAFGDEWVPDLWSAQIWQQARQDNVILPLFRAIEMPSNPFELPTEGTDPDVFYVTETSDEAHLTLGAGNPIPDSRIGSGKVTLSAKKLALRVGFSAELVEDAVVPVLNIYREQAARAIADAIDHVLLNGDTAASGNINLLNGTPTTTAKYRALDGVRKQAIANAVAVNAAGAPTLSNMRAARFAMPTPYAARPSDLAWIVDGNTYAKMLGISEFLTMDKAGALATALTGQIGYADGIPVLLSAEMPDAVDADGYIDSNTANNTQGSAVCVYRPGWFVGYRRRINVSVDYIPYYDSYQLTATVRLAFAPTDTSVASMLHNITVA
jgi:HK97 family phage major capsid protein